MPALLTFVIFIAILGLLVLSHEWGHFIVAKKSGMQVDEFGFGFPPTLLGIQRLRRRLASGQEEKKWSVVFGARKAAALKPEDGWEGGTVYTVNLIPLGGFVKIKGENATDPHGRDQNSFASKKVWQKAAVLVAGVAMNVLVAAVLLSIGYMVGIPQAVGSGSGTQNNSLTIIEVLPGKPAEAAGLEAGDVFLSVNDLQKPSLTALQDYVNAHRSETLSVTVQRGDAIITKQIHPIVYEDTGKGGLGVGIAEVGLVKHPWYKAIYYGFTTAGYLLVAIVKAFFLLIKGLFVGATLGGAVSGPVGVAVMTGKVARLGFVPLLQFTALLSLNLAVLNILPIPALDGGRLFFVLLGKILPRPITPYVEQLVHTIGFVLLMALVVVVTIKDLGVYQDKFIQTFQQIF